LDWNGSTSKLLSMIYCGWFARMILYAIHMLIMFTALLWINPFTEILVSKNNDGGKGVHLVSEIHWPHYLKYVKLSFRASRRQITNKIV
jgi:hypothetical protein